MMQLFIQVDGLLRRFGRVVPDAIAMASGIHHIQSRLQTSGQNAQISPLLFRLCGDCGSSSPGLCRGTVAPEAISDIKNYFNFTGEVLCFRELLLLSNGDQGEQKNGQLVVLTTDVDAYNRCLEEGVTAVRIGDSGSPTERWAPFSDIVRLLEEHLRIPTARPMAAWVRTGGLLAIQEQDSEAAWTRALSLIQEDPNADWVILDNVLILYTENPDLEDSLETEPGIKRLALAVHKENLFLDINGNSVGSDSLYQSGPITLLEIPQQPKADPEVQAWQRPWNRIRRRRLGHTQREREESRKTQVLPKKLVIITNVADGFQDALEPNTQHWLQKVRRLISNTLNHNSTSCYYEQGEPRAVTWTTNYGITEKDLLVTLLYRFSVDDVNHQEKSSILANALQGILAISQWIESISKRLGVVHCITLHRNVSIDRVLKSVLFEEEQNRLSRIVEFDDILSVQTDREKLIMYADPHLRDMLEELGSEGASVIWSVQPCGIEIDSQVRLVGGTWCQSPQNLKSVSLVQDVLEACLC